MNEVVSTIMLNFIATGISAFLLAEYFRNDKVTLIAETKPIGPSGWLPPLNRLLEVVGYHLPARTLLQGFLPFAIVIGVGYYLVVWRTRFGFELRTTGVNPAAATASGVNHKAMILKTIMLSGAVAGLIGLGTAARGSATAQVRRHVPDRHRLHRHLHRPPRAQQPDRDRHRRVRVGRRRAAPVRRSRPSACPRRSCRSSRAPCC